ncbi:MAG TPA: phosphoserine phosphatase SerB, partial [Burkholderiales bacterium]
MNLVVQGPTLSRDEVRTVSEMAGSPVTEQLGPAAFRLRNSRKSDAIEAWCDAHRIDCAWMPEGRRFADLKLLAMDMDSTLITIECIDELGDLAGKKAQIAAVTEQAMRGELDFAGA